MILESHLSFCRPRRRILPSYRRRQPRRSCRDQMIATFQLSQFHDFSWEKISSKNVTASVCALCRFCGNASSRPEPTVVQDKLKFVAMRKLATWRCVHATARGLLRLRDSRFRRRRRRRAAGVRDSGGAAGVLRGRFATSLSKGQRPKAKIKARWLPKDLIGPHSLEAP